VPTINLSFTGGSPIVTAAVQVSRYREDALRTHSKPVPEWVAARLLVDTGASVTCLDPKILAPLGVQPSGVTPIHTPSTEGEAHSRYQYDVQLHIQGSHNQPPLYFPLMSVVGTSFTHQGIDGLLGRDVLAHCLLIYNASLGIFTLSY